MKLHSLNVDIQKIAEGLYDLIEQKDETAIVAFGMIPKWAVDALEKGLHEKIVSDAATHVGLSGEELSRTSLVDTTKVEVIVRDISHAVCIAIYAVAKARGKMCV